MEKTYNFEGGIGRDAFLSADGMPVDVLNQNNNNRQFTITITNPMAVKRDIFLTPGNDFSNLLQLIAEGAITIDITAKSVDGTNPAANVPAEVNYVTAPGYILEGEFFGVNEDSASYTAMTATSQPRKIREFFQYVANNPTTLTQLKINDSLGDGMQINNPLEVIATSPFRQLASSVINPSFYITQNSMNQNNCLFNTSIILSNQTKIKYSISPAITVGGVLTPRTVTMTFNCGITLNTADALENKIEEAKALKVAQVRAVLTK